MRPSMTLDDMLTLLKERQDSFSPLLRRTACFAIDNPGEVGVSSLRDLADKAGVKPNSFVRLAKTLDLETFEEFRRPFRDAARQEVVSFSDRARWLQELGRGNGGDDLYAQITGALFSNVSFVLQTLDPSTLRNAAKLVTTARNCHLVALGSCYPALLEFYYVARMALPNIRIGAPSGGVLMDDLIEIGPDDVVIAASYRPYRSETVRAVRLAKERGAAVIAITDGYSSPIAVRRDLTFVAPATTPQIFPSTLALSTALETFLAFVVAEAGPAALQRIEAFHRMRSNRGVYWETVAPEGAVQENI